MKEICKKDGRYKEVIKESSIVKNAVILLGGRRRGNGGEKERKEGEEEEKGELNEIECVEMNVGEKISEGRDGDWRRGRDEGSVDGIGRRRE